MTESEASKRYREEMDAKYGSEDSPSKEDKKKQARDASDKYTKWANSSEKLEYDLDIQNKKVAAKLGWSKPT